MSVVIKNVTIPSSFTVYFIDSDLDPQIMVRNFLFLSDPRSAVVLDYLEKVIFPHLPALKSVDNIKNLIVVIHADSSATVYLNEIRVIAKMRSKLEGIDTGQTVTTNDISGVDTISFEGVSIQEGEGLIHVFEFLDQRGLYFDLYPFHFGPRNYNLSKILGRCYSYTFFQARLRIEPATYKLLRKHGWFPFIGLTEGTIAKIISTLKNGESGDALLDRIIDESIKPLENSIENWDKSPFVEHREFLKTALDRFFAEDYISSISILYLRIEGLLRSNFNLKANKNRDRRINEDILLEAATKNVDQDTSPLLPVNFSRYMRKVFWSNFSPYSKGHPLSRHSLTHGVVSEEHFTKKWAVIGFLIVQHLRFLIRQNESSDE